MKKQQLISTFPEALKGEQGNLNEQQVIATVIAIGKMLSQSTDRTWRAFTRRELLCHIQTIIIIDDCAEHRTATQWKVLKKMSEHGLFEYEEDSKDKYNSSVVPTELFFEWLAERIAA